MSRVSVDGKHLELEGRPYRVRGVTYGSFLPRLDGELFPDPSQVKRDFAGIEAAGMNVVRTYTVPPPEMLDLAREMDLRVLVGLQYEDWRYHAIPGRRIRRQIRDAGRRALEEAMDRCAGRPEVFAIAVGNEVPADVVRVHGIGHVQEALSELVDEVHRADPSMLATYCNFPTTEYLQLDGQDLFCFNLFLEDPAAFRRYVRHLQIVADDLPLVLTEVGLASVIHGEEAQAEALSWQLRIADESGCAGATVFAWTDEWGVDGQPVAGWGFGISDGDRNPRPALDAVTAWAGSSIKDLRAEWPRISAVVCAYNGDQLIKKCLASLQRCEYPNLEVIVCDDGSTDKTLEIARGFPFEILELERGGLSAARNAGLEAATGEIVAFIDADAFCHPEWPFHLALSMEDDNVVASGGPNSPVEDTGLVERAVAQSPGGPIHVLLSDDRAEHIPGCNMAYRRAALEAIGGFDPIFTAAGDDVDVCWKILDLNQEIAFAPAAQVRHHRRDTIRGYLKQQRGYGRAERLLSGRHPYRFNALGQARWTGFIYGGPRFLPALLRPVVYHGYHGSSPYQPIIGRRSEALRDMATAVLPLSLPLGILGAVLVWASSWWLTITGVMAAIVVGYATAIALGVRVERQQARPLAFRLLVAFLHVAQPFARMWGRLGRRPAQAFERARSSWSGDRFVWLTDLRKHLIRRGCRVRAGGPGEAWDLEVSIGPFLCCRVTTAVLWRWTPAHRLSFRPRVWVAVAVAVALLAARVNLETAGILLVFVAGAAFVEGVFLHRVIRKELRATAPETHS
jgi:glycosyltransferase involved in cell wall biosynthesis